jgi:hypothetical protein
MILTTGLLGLAGIGGTAFGAAVSPTSTALTRRRDRSHEIRLKFDERAWEDKKAALMDIIRKASDIRRACKPDSSWGAGGIPEEIQFARMRVRSLEIYHQNPTDFVPTALLAYASKKVCDLTEHLERMLKENYTTATTVNLNRLESYREEWAEQEDPTEAIRLLGRAQNFEDTIGTGAEGLNTHELNAMCDRVIKAAKKFSRVTSAKAGSQLRVPWPLDVPLRTARAVLLMSSIRTGELDYGVMQ